MVIIGKKSGQLGNRLLVFAHFVANAIEHGYHVQNPSFYDYAHYFAHLKDDFFCRYPARKSCCGSLKPVQGAYLKALTRAMLLYKKIGLKGLDIEVLNVTGKNFRGDNYDMGNPDYVGLAKRSRVLLVKDGWLFRDFSSLAKHADQVRGFFAPAQQHALNVERLVATARRDCDLLVGVHIRQGDYRKWENGRYFYSTSDYAKLMKRCLASWPGRRVKFLVCSNAAQDERLFEGMDYLMGSNHQLEDMYAFAQCDYLLGPPSTYTMWASFYGARPLNWMMAVDGPVTASDFVENSWAASGSSRIN